MDWDGSEAWYKRALKGREVRLLAATLAFVLGTATLQSLAELPPGGLALFLPIGCLAWLVWRRGRIALAACLGFVWAAWVAALQQAEPLPWDSVGKDLVVEGVVASLPEEGERSTRFVLRALERSEGEESVPFSHRIRLSWYADPPGLHPGARWRLKIRVKPPHGFANPGGFDYEKWLWQQGITATGYVRNSPANQKLSDDWWVEPVHRVRFSLRERILGAIGAGEEGGLALALAIGDRSLLSRKQWSSFTHTGTSHLVAISGLHIGIVAGIAWWLSRRVWAAIPRLAERIPSPHAAAIGAILAALGYAALAGFAIPTQRALIMLGVGFGSLLCRRSISLLRVMCYALLAVLVMDPLAVLAGGFWLSFGAVAAILFVSTGRIGFRSLWNKWGAAQVAVFVGLLPMLLLMFGQVSLIAPLANLLAVPWFSLVLVPAVLAGIAILLVMPSWGERLLDWLQTPLEWTIHALDWMARTPFSIWFQAEPPFWVWPFAFFGVVLLLAPHGWPARWLGVVALLPLLTFRAPAPGPGELWLTVLDVGQGGAAVLRTAHHTLVFDAGPRYSRDFDAGAAVLVPYLRNAGIREIDVLVLSNADSDHAGGARSVLDQVPVLSLLSGEPEELDLPEAKHCVAGQRWSWDGIEIAVLHPYRPGEWKGNNASCVLRARSPEGRTVLLTGDIEADAERGLVQRSGGELASDILIVPHHGSGTSSTPDFVSAVAPRFAVVSAGYLNRWGFPKAEVRDRWASAGATLISTAESGAIDFRIAPNGSLPAPSFYRERDRHYWSTPPFFGEEALQ